MENTAVLSFAYCCLEHSEKDLGRNYDWHVNVEAIAGNLLSDMKFGPITICIPLSSSLTQSKEVD